MKNEGMAEAACQYPKLRKFKQMSMNEDIFKEPICVLSEEF